MAMAMAMAMVVVVAVVMACVAASSNWREPAHKALSFSRSVGQHLGSGQSQMAANLARRA